MKNLLRAVTPPLLLESVRRFRNRHFGFFGNYDSFAAAEADAEGYEAPDVVNASTGRRTDFDYAIDIGSRAQQLLAALTMISARPISVLDFGGASGGYFHQLKSFVDLRWAVLETPALASANQHLTTDRLSFIGSADDLELEYDVVLMSGVLQYLADPHATFQKLSRLAPLTLLNRLPLIAADKDRLTVQRVHPSIYRGSYPAWFFSRDEFIAKVSVSHDLVMRWNVPEDEVRLDSETVRYQGMLLRRRGDSSGLPPLM